MHPLYELPGGGTAIDPLLVTRLQFVPSSPEAASKIIITCGPYCDVLENRSHAEYVEILHAVNSSRLAAKEHFTPQR